MTWWRVGTDPVQSVLFLADARIQFREKKKTGCVSHRYAISLHRYLKLSKTNLKNFFEFILFNLPTHPDVISVVWVTPLALMRDSQSPLEVVSLPPGSDLPNLSDKIEISAGQVEGHLSSDSATANSSRESEGSAVAVEQQVRFSRFCYYNIMIV